MCYINKLDIDVGRGRAGGSTRATRRRGSLGSGGTNKGRTAGPAGFTASSQPTEAKHGQFIDHAAGNAAHAEMHYGSCSLMLD